MEDQLRRNNLKILDFFHRVKKREVPTEEILSLDPKLASFLNVNTPEDLPGPKIISAKEEMTLRGKGP
jgi:molybdopterin-guanine dinucleotide biosynthesis protein A